jgi:hypothetical protein
VGRGSWVGGRGSWVVGLGLWAVDYRVRQPRVHLIRAKVRTGRHEVYDERQTTTPNEHLKGEVTVLADLIDHLRSLHPHRPLCLGLAR